PPPSWSLSPASGPAATSPFHLQSSCFTSSRSPMKTVWRKYFSCVHPLYFTRATTAGFTQDGFSLVSGTLSNGHVDAANSFHLLFNSACFLASNPLPNCPLKRNFVP